MDPTPLLDRITDDEGLTEGLAEPEAMLLVRELAERVRRIASRSSNLIEAQKETAVLCRRARATAKTVAADPSADKAAILRRLIAEWPD